MVIKSGKQSGGELISKKVRSAAYPLLSLPKAIEAAKKIYDNLGAGPHSRESLARGLGYASFSGAASGKIGAMAHFGLLSRMSGRYSITARARAIFRYPSENCLAEIAAAAIQPSLYRGLVVRFAGDSLPNALEAVLVADYGITQKAAVIAAANFVETAKFADIIKEGRLVVPEIGVLPEIGAMQDVSGSDSDAQEKELSGAVEENKGVKIKLLSGVEIIFPDSFSYRLSMGEFAGVLKDLDKKASGVE